MCRWLVHQGDHLVAQVLARTPTAGPLLLPAVREELAVKALGRGAACLRLRGCLALAERAGAAALREGVLGLVLRCLLDLDADIRWQDIAPVPGAPSLYRQGVQTTCSDLGGAWPCGALPAGPGCRHSLAGHRARAQMRPCFVARV